MRKLLFVFAVLFYNAVFAQNVKVEVNGLYVGVKYSKEQIFQAFGAQPTKIRDPQPMDEEPNTYIFYFGEDVVEWVDGFIDRFVLTTSKYSFNDIIQVGDSISKIAELGGIATYDNENEVYWKPTTDPKLNEFWDIWIVHKNGIITKMFIGAITL